MNNIPTTKVSSAQKIQEHLAALITKMKAGDKLPSEPQLAKQFGVSRATLREAMRTFETQGLLLRRQGAGTYIMQPPAVIESGLEVLESIETQAKRIGLEVTMGDLKVEKRKANAQEVKELDISEGDNVLHVSRAILTGGKAVAYLIDILPEGILGDEDLTAQFRGSVLDLLLKRGNPPLHSSRCEISSAQANSELAKIFGIQRGDSLLLFTAWLYSTSGKVVDYSFSYFLPGYFRFHVIRKVGQ
ncbi:MAG: GntR family transcriptional regulator [Anaerolineales bacterium]